MSAIVYTQRFKPVNKRSTPNKNAEHIRYIGTRPGAMKNEGKSHRMVKTYTEALKEYYEQKKQTEIRMDELREAMLQSKESKNLFTLPSCKSLIDFKYDLSRPSL